MKSKPKAATKKVAKKNTKKRGVENPATVGESAKPYRKEVASSPTFNRTMSDIRKPNKKQSKIEKVAGSVAAEIRAFLVRNMEVFEKGATRYNGFSQAMGDTISRMKRLQNHIDENPRDVVAREVRAYIANYLYNMKVDMKNSINNPRLSPRPKTPSTVAVNNSIRVMYQSLPELGL